MSRTRQTFGRALAGAALALSVALPLGAAAHRMPTDVVYNFTGGADGGLPEGGLIGDAAGNFYGATSGGGGSNCAGGCGVVFRLSPLGVATTLYTFTGGSDGSGPFGKLIADAAGNLYGAATGGGAHGLGVVFKLTPGGQETVLYSFTGGSDGANPSGGLAQDAAGNFYGATAGGDGTVFKLAPDGALTVLHGFTGGADGSHPNGGVILDKHGNLYGSASHGGDHGDGNIFKIATDGAFSVLYSFTGGADGGVPLGGVVMDKQGALYGATVQGGERPCRCGVVFKFAPDGALTVLHAFDGRLGGRNPEGALTLDKQGALYGVTRFGGDFNRGTVFQLSPDGTETVLHSFAFKHDRPPDGVNPVGGLVLHMNRLHGVTTTGGAGTGGVCTIGCGVVFEVKKAK